MIKKFTILTICFCFLGASAVLAQKPTVKASLDSTQMIIGEQCMLRFEIKQAKSDRVIFPNFQDSIVSGLIIAGESSIDTVELSDNSIQINAAIPVTSFDSAKYQIPAFKFLCGNDSIFSNALSLDVYTYQIADTTNVEIKDIKGVYEPKTDWTYILTVAGIVFLILLLIAAVIYIIIKKRKNKGLPTKPEIKIPAHELALKALNEVKAEKIWKNGKEKEYYTQITDILRQYIENRFEIPAIEMTTDDILDILNDLKPEYKESIKELSEVLKLSDLVKFAKWIPTLNDHENTLNHAFNFVNSSMQLDDASTEKDDSIIQN